MQLINFSELYDGWINYERQRMIQNKLPEESVYKQHRKTNASYQNDIRDALFVFWDWLSVFIPIQKYNLYESSEILISLSNIAENYKNAYNEIKYKLEIGETVQPYQRHLNEKFQTKLNYIFTHWNIRHLHLNTLQDEQANVKPTQYILFIRIENNNAYLIDIAKHTRDGHEFHDERLLTIIDNNWSSLLIKSNMPVSSLPQPIEPESLKTLRKNNWNIIHVINGKAIVSGSRINSAGGKLESMKRYGRAVFILRELEACLNANYPFTKKISNKVLYVLPSGRNSGIIVFDDGSVIICKINKDDTNFIDDNFKIVKKVFPNLLKSTTREIKKQLHMNQSLLIYIPFSKPNTPYVKTNFTAYQK